MQRIHHEIDLISTYRTHTYVAISVNEFIINDILQNAIHIIFPECTKVVPYAKILSIELILCLEIFQCLDVHTLCT